MDEIEAEVFGGNPDVSRRVYELSREVIEFQRAVGPLDEILNGLTAGIEKYGIDEESTRYVRDVQDHAIGIAERVEGLRQLLQNILSVNLAIAWAAILFAPTVIGTVYGMNFDHMPDLRWEFGYSFALSLMVLVCVVLYMVFKRRGWL